MDKETIKKIRIKALMNKEEFAEALGVSTGTVTNWEKGTYNITMRNWRKVLAFCQEKGIDVEKL